jgi:Secretion system C-terminal sorting domain
MAVGSKDTIFLSLINSDARSLISYNGGKTWEKKTELDIFLDPGTNDWCLFNNAIYASVGYFGSKLDLKTNKTEKIFNDHYQVIGVFGGKLLIDADRGDYYYTTNGKDWTRIEYGGIISIDENKNIYIVVGGFSGYAEIGIIKSERFGNTLPTSTKDPRIIRFGVYTNGSIVALKDSNNFVTMNKSGLWKTRNQGLEYERTIVKNEFLPITKLTKSKNRYYCATQQGIFYADNTPSSWKLLNETDPYLFVPGSSLYADENILFMGHQYPPKKYSTISRDSGRTWTGMPKEYTYNIYRTKNGYYANIENYLYFSKDILKTFEFAGVSAEGIENSGDNILGLDKDGRKVASVEGDGQLRWADITTIPYGIPVKAIAASGDKWYALDGNGKLHFTSDRGKTWKLLENTAGINFAGNGDSKLMAYGDTLLISHYNNLQFITEQGKKNIFISSKEQDGYFENSIKDGYLYIVGSYFEGSTNIWRRALSDVKMVSLKGDVFVDTNNNGKYDLDEYGMDKAKIVTKLTGNVAITDSLGRFEMLGDANLQDTMVVKVEPLPVYLLNPPSRLVKDFILDGNNRFGVHITRSVKALSVKAVNTSAARAGFPFSAYLAYRNLGGSISSGVVRFYYDKYFTPKTMSPVPTSTNIHYIEWAYKDLYPTEEQFIRLNFDISRIAPLKYITQNTANVVPLEGNNYPLSGADTLNLQIVGSFDPNDKQVTFTNSKVAPAVIQKNTELIYTIRFQNTGNFKADFVRVVDTISNKLDMTSINMLAMSHAYEVTIKNKNVLIVDFKDINLPDSTKNERESHGFIRFSIKPKATLTDAEVIKNKAFIYFDFNDPILTNTTETRNAQKLVKTIDLSEPQIAIFPNPTSGRLSFPLEKSIGQEMKTEIFDVSGRLCFATSDKSAPMNHLNVAFLNEGIYMLRVQVGNAYVVGRFVVQK